MHADTASRLTRVTRAIFTVAFGVFGAALVYANREDVRAWEGALLTLAVWVVVAVVVWFVVPSVPRSPARQHTSTWVIVILACVFLAQYLTDALNAASPLIAVLGWAFVTGIALNAMWTIPIAMRRSRR